MKLTCLSRWLLLPVLLLVPLTEARAASPTFQSFNTNDFVIITNLSAPWSIHANRANTTNGFTNVVIINTNVFITNINSTIVNTNVLIENTFVTNIVDNSVVIITNTTVTLNGTNVATINPTVGRLPYNGDGVNLFDSALYFIDTNTVGAVEVDTETLGVTNLVTGGVVISVPAGGFGYLTNVVNGSGVLTNDGVGNMGWVPSTILPPVMNPTDGFVPYRSNATAFADSPFYVVSLTNAALDGQLLFGPGTTNILRREGNYLVATNGGASQATGFQFRGGDGTTVAITPGGSVGALRGDGGAGLLDALSGGRELRWWNNTLTPVQTSTALGATGGGQQPWSYAMIGSSNRWGFMGVTSGIPNVLVNGTNYALGSGIVNNTTTGFIPYWSGTALESSPWYSIDAASLGFNGTNFFLYGGSTISDLALGRSALAHRPSGLFTTAIGAFALNSLTSGSGNIAIGANSMQLFDGGANNIGIGSGTLFSSSGANNIAIGQNSGNALGTGFQNALVGVGSGQNGNFTNSVFIGHQAGVNTATTEGSVFVGKDSGLTNTTGFNNVFVGYASNPMAATDTNTIVIGASAVGHGANTATLGNSTMTSLFIGTNQVVSGPIATGLTITASVTNAVVATIGGRKVYLLIANETPP